MTEKLEGRELPARQHLGAHPTCLSERGGGGAHFIGNSQRPRLRRVCEPLEPVGLQQSKPI